jgi:hypothetical protein
MGMKKKEEVKTLPPVPAVPTAVQHTYVKTELKEKAGDDKGFRKPVDERTASIERQAIIKSVLESPMLAQLAVGKNTKECKDLLTEIFNHSVDLFYGKK